MVQGYIYRHWIINDEGVEKSYIGQTTDNNPRRRWQGGIGYTKQGQDSKMSRAIKKYGWENFSHEIVGVVESDTKEQLIRDLDEWEKYYIFKYDSFHNGYNSTTGGGNGFYTDETRQKLREIATKQWSTMTEEEKEKHREKSIQRMNEMTEEEETERRRKIKAKAKKKKVECITTGELFESTMEASRYYNIHSSHIIHCCQGRRKSCGKHPITGEKLCWKYYEKDE